MGYLFSQTIVCNTSYAIIKDVCLKPSFIVYDALKGNANIARTKGNLSQLHLFELSTDKYILELPTDSRHNKINRPESNQINSHVVLINVCICATC